MVAQKFTYSPTLTRNLPPFHLAVFFFAFEYHKRFLEEFRNLKVLGTKLSNLITLIVIRHLNSSWDSYHPQPSLEYPLPRGKRTFIRIQSPDTVSSQLGLI